MRDSTSAVKVAAVIFWFAVGIVYFWNLGGGSLEFWDESLTAERSREFLLTDDWLTPHSSFQPVFNKPPLYYWLTALNFVLVGEGEYAVRLGSVLFGIGCLMFVCLLGRKATGRDEGGLLAAFLLATNPHWINYTRNGMLDSGLMFGTLAGIYFLIDGRPVAGVVLSGISFAVGCLIKNPLALVGLVVPLAQQLFVERSAGRGRRILFAALIACLLSLAWYGLEVLKWGNAYLDQFVGYNMVQRFSHSIEGHDTNPYFYLKVWSGGSVISFAFFFLPLAYFLVRRRGSLRPVVPYLVIASLFLILLSVSASKRGFYLLLIYPFVAIASAGMGLTFLDSVKKTAVRAGLVSLFILGSVIYLGARYDPCIDGSADLKEIAFRLKTTAGADAVIYTLGIPSDPVMFYSHVLTRSVWEDLSAEDLNAMMKRADGPVYFWMRNDKKDAVLRSVTAAGLAVSPAFESEKYAVMLLSRR